VFLRLLLVLCLSFFKSQSWALDLELTQGINATLPIGIQSLGYSGVGQEITHIIHNDLRLSGQFKLIAAPPAAQGELSSPQFWRRAGADSLLTGQLRALGDNRFEISLKLLDTVAEGHVLLEKTYQINQQQARALAHHISDLVYEKLIGERGIFSTRIAYVRVLPTHGRLRYMLDVADADGFHPQSLVVSSEPIMSPSWSPDGQKIAYVSFEKKHAHVFVINVESGKRQLITRFSGINGAPAWSPDGRKLALVLSKTGSPKIYQVDLSNGALKQLTFGDAIDTEPHFAPDGRHLLFTSGRGGSPQVYELNLQDGSIHRMTYDGHYNARASYTPNQQSIVMLHRDEDKRFHIGVQHRHSTSITSLTFSSLDESPSVAPNGRLILYATRFNHQGVLGMVSIDGKIKIRLPLPQGDVQEPAWSPYLS
tara:strand:+ start:714 stop:1985 length:1272 start_codon:yes stop_codon:yes gene_type:complete